VNSISTRSGPPSVRLLRRAVVISCLVSFLSNVDIGFAPGLSCAGLSCAGLSCAGLSWSGPLAARLASASEPDEKQAAKQRVATQDTQAAAYTLGTHRQSYFKLDENGALELQDKLPYQSEKTYHFQRTIHPDKTAIVVMDPWVDMASEHLNNYFGKIAESRVIPLVKHALELGHPIIVLTNDPDVVDYNTDVHAELVTLEANGKLSILFHQGMDDKGFASYLRSRKIDSLVYVGFASNMCVIGRRMGMIPMVQQGFRLYFVPEASAAVEVADTWQDQSVHRATTKIISQWIAEIVDYDEFIRVGRPARVAAAPPLPSK